MLSKKQKGFIQSLQHKKYQKQHQLFVAQGIKVVKELLETSRFSLHSLYYSLPEFPFPTLKDPNSENVFLIPKDQLQQISTLKTAPGVLALFSLPQTLSQDTLLKQKNTMTVVLDQIRDPGNLGTIIRLCDWFGIENIICAKDSVGVFNPKVVQASMASITRVKVHYVCLPEFLSEKINQQNAEVLGTFMDAKSLYDMQFPKRNTAQNKADNTLEVRQQFMVFGNEANGISPEIKSLCTQKISIPQYNGTDTESLNVAMAVSIVLAEYRRQIGE